MVDVTLERVNNIGPETDPKKCEFIRDEMKGVLRKKTRKNINISSQ